MRKSIWAGIKTIIFALLMIAVPARAAGSCLRIEYINSYGQPGFDFTYANFSVFDLGKGLHQHYFDSKQNPPNSFSYSPRVTPNKRYLMWLTDTITPDGFKTEVTVTSTGLDRQPIVQLNFDGGLEDVSAVWMRDNEHLLIFQRKDDDENKFVSLVNVPQKRVVRKEITSKDTYSPNGIVISQDQTRLIVHVLTESGSRYEIWSTQDLSIIGTFQLPKEVVILHNFYRATSVWRPGTDEFAYLRLDGQQLSVVMASLSSPLTPVSNLPIPVSYLARVTGELPQVEWTPDGNFLSILLNHTDAPILSYLFVVDARTKPYKLLPMISKRVSSCTYCVSALIRWSADHKTLYFLERLDAEETSKQPLSPTNLIAYSPLTQTLRTVARHVYDAEHDPSETLLLVTHHTIEANKEYFGFQYLSLDGSIDWTAFQVEGEYVPTYNAPDFRKLAVNAGDDLLWADLNLRQQFRIHFDLKKTQFQSWSADSKSIAFQAINRFTGAADIGVADVLTGKHRIILRDVQNILHDSVAVASTGQISFFEVIDTQFMHPITAFTLRLRMFRADGTEVSHPMPLYAATDSGLPITNWSPDGSKLAAWNSGPGNRSFMTILQSDGTVLHQFEDMPYVDHRAEFVWIPCDQKLVGWSVRSIDGYPHWP
jgi:hypothetical protein